MKNIKYSYFVLALIFIVFTYDFNIKINEVRSGEKACLTAYDGFGYYMYLPFLFNEGSLNITPEWAKEIQGKYCEEAGVYQFVPTSDGRYANIYHIGLSILYLPSYLIGELAARLLDYPSDGFSFPYIIAHILNSLFFIFLGAYFLRKLLLLFFNEKITALLLVIIYASTNLFITFSRQYDLPHLFLFTLNALFLYFLFKGDKRNIDKKDLRNAAIVLGLSVAIRPTQALFGLIPFIILLDQYGFTRLLWKRLSVFFVWGFIWAMPQIIYSIVVSGKLYLLNLHSEVIAFSDPHLIDFLFSFKKGWLLYSPVFLLMPFAFASLYKKDRLLFKSFLVFVLINIYVLSSWENWWYATSFGSRVMVDSYPLLAIILGFLFLGGEKLINKIAVGLFVLISTLLNILQSYQYRKGYIDFSRMTKQHYFYVFGKTSIPNYHRGFLEMNRGDIHWIENAKKLNYSGYEFEDVLLFESKVPVISSNVDEVPITKIKINELLPSDESLIKIRVRSKTSNSEIKCRLWFQLESRYNNYSWNALEISFQKTENEEIESSLEFNLAPVRHNNDVLRVYLEACKGGEVQIDEINIEATSLRRK